MSTSPFGPVPGHLADPQRSQWLHRQQTAQHVLETQALAGTKASAETLAALQRYVRGELELGIAIAQARAQLAQERTGFWQALQHRNLI